MAEARGQDLTVRVFYDGAIQPALTLVRDVGFETGLETDSEGYVGHKTNLVSGINGDASLNLSNVIGDPAYLTLADYQRRKNKGDAAYRDLRLDCTLTVDFGAGSKSKVQMLNSTLSGAGVSVGGRTDKVTGSPVLTSGDWKRIS